MLRRYTPLKRTPFARPTPIGRGVGLELLAALRVRSGGRCEMGLAGCQGWASDPCHRIARKAGGRRGAARALSDRLSNLVHGCRSCHDWTHAHPDEARLAGLFLMEGTDPTAAPVRLARGLLGHGWFWLADDGSIHRSMP